MSLIYCQCYSGNIRLTCSKCHLIFNTNSGKITEQDSKQVMLEKLKKELQSLRANIMCLKIDIRDLENEIANQDANLNLSIDKFLPQKRSSIASVSEKDDSCSDISDEECILSSGAVVEKAGLPNCDCKNCS